MMPKQDDKRNAKSVPVGDYFLFALLSLLAVIWISVRLMHLQLDFRSEVVLSGLAIVAGSFLLTWAAEAAERDVPQAFALGVLALIIVIPEYAVDMYLAWKAAVDPAYLHYPTANMTGANRLLIGLGWALIAILYMVRNRKAELKLDSPRNVELAFLYAATLYSFVIPIKGTLSLADAVVFLWLFVLYARALAKSERKESELVGPALTLAEMPTAMRRGLVVTFMSLAGVGIFFSAEPFSEGLLTIGQTYNMSKYLLIQWIAPLASEAPELIIATLLTLKSRPGAAFGALISSKVNQWTLLIGMLPLTFNLSALLNNVIVPG
ncbi:MAG: sodium:calcium antiporter, partial [bacterium]